MARVVVAEGSVRIDLSPAEKVTSLHGDLSIPLEHVAGVSAEPAPYASQRGVRVGVGIPGSSHGTFSTPDGLVFCAYRNALRCITLRLARERYRRVIVEVDPPQEPEQVRVEIEAALGAA